MRLTFYIYWTWYIVATFFISKLDMSLEMAKTFVCLHHLSQVLLVVIPMCTILITREQMDIVNWKYFEGCILSFLLRSMSFMLSVWGVRDNYILLALSGTVMGLWYLFNLDKFFNKL